jgi:hypothetical protein
MHLITSRYLLPFMLAAIAMSGMLSGCGSSPADFGITGPAPRPNLSPPPVQAADNPDATSVIPGVQTGSGMSTSMSPILNAPAVPGTFYGSD